MPGSAEGTVSGSATAVKGMVLAAGRGTRLRPLTEFVPKPLVPVLNRPVVVHTIDWLHRFGVDDLIINTQHLGGRLREALERSPVEGTKVQFLEESTLLGTGGGLKNAAPFFEGEDAFPVVNGDVITRFDVGAAMDAQRSEGAAATLVVVRRPDLDPNLHKVAWDDAGRVAEIDGVVAPGVAARYRGIYTGAVVATNRLVDVLPAGREACLKEEGFWPLLRQGVPLSVYETDTYWSDVGTPERYLETHRELFASRESVLASLLPTDVVERSPAVWAHPSAHVDPSAVLRPPLLLGAGVSIGPNAQVGPMVVLGEDARVEPGSTITDVIGWRECSIEGSAHHGIVWSEGSVTL